VYVCFNVKCPENTVKFVRRGDEAFFFIRRIPFGIPGAICMLQKRPIGETPVNLKNRKLGKNLSITNIDISMPNFGNRNQGKDMKWLHAWFKRVKWWQT
jgi:hypothetical protein